MQFSRPIHVIGAGAFGSALAHTWHRAGRDVVHVDDSWDRVGELRIETTPAAA